MEKKNNMATHSPVIHKTVEAKGDTHTEEKTVIQKQEKQHISLGVKNLLEGIKQKGRPFEIPNCSRDDLPEFFVKMGYKKGAEIGVYKGEFSEKFAKAGLELSAIDPWRVYKDFIHPKGQDRLDFQFEHTQRVLAPFPNAKIIRKTSMEAVEDFKDESLDFVYIDGNHEFRYVAEDISEWAKKVRKGGIVSGHDYFYHKSGTGKDHWHVAYVLKAYIGAFGISRWFLLGSKDVVPGETRDTWRSWMFIKE